MPVLIAAALLLGFSAAVPMAASEIPALPAGTLALFTITKSENKNQVQYAILVDDHCAPKGDTPVFAYWRMLEKGPARMEPLLAREIPAYGLATQQVTTRDASGGVVRMTLHALPSREIVVQTRRDGAGACQTWSMTLVAGAPAHLYNVHVRIAWPFIRVDYLLLQAWSLDGTHVVTEKIKN